MKVLEAVAVTPYHDQVHALLVLDLEVAHRPAIGAADAEAQLARAGALEDGAVELEREAALRDREPPNRGGSSRATGVAAGVGVVRVPAAIGARLRAALAAAVGPHGVTRERGRAEHQDERHGEGRKL